MKKLLIGLVVVWGGFAIAESRVVPDTEALTEGSYRIDFKTPIKVPAKPFMDKKKYSTVYFADSKAYAEIPKDQNAICGITFLWDAPFTFNKQWSLFGYRNPSDFFFFFSFRLEIRFPGSSTFSVKFPEKSGENSVFVLKHKQGYSVLDGTSGHYFLSMEKVTFGQDPQALNESASITSKTLKQCFGDSTMIRQVIVASQK